MDVDQNVKKVGVGLIGAGWMGQAHATAFRNAAMFFGASGVKADLVTVADINMAAAQKLAGDFRFTDSADDWRKVVNDPRVQLIDITTPNHAHAEIAIAAAKAGKHVYCEKPMALTVEDSAAMADQAKASDVITLVGYNYLKNPTQAYAKSLIDAGELGEITSFRGTFDQDLMADPTVPHSWRHIRAAAGSGALGDLATHTLAFSQFLVGDIAETCGLAETFIKQRSDERTGTLRDVENDDVVHFIMRYANGALGEIASSRIGMGRRLGLGYEIQGTKGALFFTQERMNELQFYDTGLANGDRGYRTIYAGPGHGAYGAFHPIPGIGLGYNDQKIIEAQDILVAVSSGTPVQPDFEFGHKVSVAVAAVEKSIAEHRWVEIGEFK